MGRLQPQLVDGVEIITSLDDGDRTIGWKRNQLCREASGEYQAHVDDDDLPSPDYVAKVVEALDEKPDCVGFKVRRFVDGVQPNNDIAIHSIRNPAYSFEDRDGLRTYLRPANHLCPVRSELARRVGFKDKNWGEDQDYATRLRPLLKTEVFIDAFLYDYLFRTPWSRTREKINRTPNV
jgi:hypothetical protein